jgi:hypothetical protein
LPPDASEAAVVASEPPPVAAAEGVVAAEAGVAHAGVRTPGAVTDEAARADAASFDLDGSAAEDDLAASEDSHERSSEPLVLLPTGGKWRVRTVVIAAGVLLGLLLVLYLRHRKTSEPGARSEVLAVERALATTGAPHEEVPPPPDEQELDETDPAPSTNNSRSVSPASSGETLPEDPRNPGSSIGRFPDLPLPTLILLEKAAEQPKQRRAPVEELNPSEAEK